MVYQYHNPNRQKLFTGYIIILSILFCLLIPKSDLFSKDSLVIELDSVNQFFDNIELLRWEIKNQEAIDQLTNCIKNGVYIKIHVMRAYNELAENHRLLRDPDRALSILEDVERSYRVDPSLEKIELVRMYFYKGKSYRSNNLIDSAVYYHKKALELARKYNYNKNVLAGEIWMDLGLIQKSLGDFQKSLEYNSNAQRIFHNTLDKWQIKRAALYYALAVNYRALGDFERAANYVRMAELIFSHYGDRFISRLVNCKIVLGNCYFNDNNFKEANAVYENVFELFESKVKPTRNALRITISNNGISLLNLGEYELSKQYIEKAIGINPLETESDSSDLAYTYSNLSLIFEDLNQFEKAKELLDKCISICLELYGDHHFEVFDSYRYLARHCEKQDQLDMALDYYQKALIAGFDNFGDDNIYTNPASFNSISKDAAFNILFDKARTFRKKYVVDQHAQDLIAAFDLYVQAYELIREAANSNFMEESLLNIPENFGEDLEFGVECALTLYENTNDSKYFDQLLQFVETNKYFLLQNSVIKSNNKETLGIPDSSYQKEKDLIERINVLKRDIKTTSFEDAETEYDKRISLLKTTIEWEQVRKLWDIPNKSNITFSDLSSNFSLDSIRNQLIGDNDLLLEYFQSSDTLYTVVIGKHQERILKLPKTPELDVQLDNYLAHMFNKDNDNDTIDFADFVSASYYLYEKLVYPAISNTMSDAASTKRLIIIPSGKLSNMPFESLIREPADTATVNYWRLNYLCRDYIINYAYSVSILKNNYLAESEDQKLNILAFSYSSSDKKDVVAQRNDPYGELPFSAEELISISKWIKGNLYDGENATEYLFKSSAQDHDIIHLALHGYGDTNDILNSHLVFKGPGNETEDGKLYAHELYGIDLSRTKLVVLSACETGVGKSMKGEGVYSLARGFAYAGCPSIVMSLWKVNDKTTADLMDYFYENLAGGMPKDEALQKAKLTFIKNTDDTGAHPANWAAFIPLGNNQPIQFENPKFRWFYWILAALLVSVVKFLYLNRKLV